MKWGLGVDLTICREWRRRHERRSRQLPLKMNIAMVHQPVRGTGRACHRAEGGAVRRGWRGSCRARREALTVLVRWQLCELEHRHRIAQIRLPRDELIDLRRGTGLEGGLQLVEERLDCWIHRRQLRSREPKAAGLDELRQIEEGKRGGVVSDTRCKGIDTVEGSIYYNSLK